MYKGVIRKTAHFTDFSVKKSTDEAERALEKKKTTVKERVKLIIPYIISQNVIVNILCPNLIFAKKKKNHNRIKKYLKSHLTDLQIQLAAALRGILITILRNIKTVIFYYMLIIVLYFLI